LAATHSVEEMREIIGADSLAFLTIDGMYRAMGYAGRDALNPKFADHCFTGDYPTTLTDQAQVEVLPRQLSLLAEAS
jgi:amidophosphoribosyltransferase